MLSRRRFVGSIPAFAALTALGLPSGPVHSLPDPGAVAALVGLPGIDRPPLAATDIAGRPLVVAFWASWCPPCRNEFVHLNRVQRAFGPKGVAVIGVNVHEQVAGRDDPERLARFIAETAPQFPLHVGDDALLRTFGDVRAIPAVFVFDRSGEVTFTFQPSRGAKGPSHVTYGELVPVLRNMGL